jgi:Fur family transcriptional regulator, ferric uptake regulator
MASPATASKSPLRKYGIRLTRQRQLLFDIINNAHDHLNAEQLFEKAQKRDAKINRVTVYRTLKLLKTEGLIDELDLMHFEGEHHYYETRLKQEHAHLVCLGCGTVREYFGDPLQRMKQQIESDFGFQISVTRTEVGGYCADCRGSQARARNEETPESKAAATATKRKTGSRRRGSGK